MVIVAVPLEPDVPDEPLEPEVPDEPLEPEVPELPLAPSTVNEISYTSLVLIAFPFSYIKETSKS